MNVWNSAKSYAFIGFMLNELYYVLYQYQKVRTGFAVICYVYDIL